MLHGGAKKGLWAELIPGGMFQALKNLKDPAKNLLPQIEKAVAEGTVTNMVSNPSCSIGIKGEPGLKDGRVPRPFGKWQGTPKKGMAKSLIGTDTSHGDGDSCSVFIKGENGGCITFDNDNLTAPGTWYYVTASVKGDGAWPTLNFRSPGRKWITPRSLLTIEGTNPDEWRMIRCCVKVPEGASGFTATFGVQSLGPNEIVHYDNICVYSLPQELVTGVKLQKGE
jgi:hypothetical protein